MKRAWLLVLVACGPRGPEPVSLETAISLEQKHRPVDAAIEYARILGGLGDRRDVEAQLGRARGFRKLFDLDAAGMAAASPAIRKRFAPIEPHVGDARAILALSMQADLDLLTGPMPIERRPEALARLIEAIGFKVDRPQLRLSPIDDAELCRILLLETIAGFEYRRLQLTPAEERDRLARVYRDLSGAYASLADRPDLRPTIAERWREISESYRNLAIRLGEDALPPPPEDLGEWADHTLERFLREGAEWADRATVESTSSGDVREVERGYRAAIRHFVFAREVISVLTTEQENTLSILSIALQAWRSAITR